MKYILQNPVTLLKLNMLQHSFPFTSKTDAANTIGNGMPGGKRFPMLPATNRFTGNRQMNDVKEQDLYKRPWYAHTMHC